MGTLEKQTNGGYIIKGGFSTTNDDDVKLVKPLMKPNKGLKFKNSNPEVKTIEKKIREDVIVETTMIAPTPIPPVVKPPVVIKPPVDIKKPKKKKGFW